MSRLYILIFILLSASCSSKSYYKDTPYGMFNRSSTLVDASLKNLVTIANKNPNNQDIHRAIVFESFNTKNYPIALYALSEIDRLDMLNTVDNYNIGVLLYFFDLKEIAKNRIIYAQSISSNFFIKNKATAAMFKINDNKPLSHSDLFIN